MKGDSLNAPLAYAYELLVKQQDGLLESAQAEMPTSAKHSSEHTDDGVLLGSHCAGT